MYEAFYGLNEKPFNLTPDPRFLYLSTKHKEAFAHLLYGIRNRSGFVMVSGEIGTGKTTICRSLLKQLDPDTEVAFIFNPKLSPIDLLKSINADFGIASTADTVRGLINELNDYLLQQAAKGKNCVLIIDEAQNLGTETLEQVRLLSNLETETEKLLQIVLIGQPELAQKLELPELRQLNQRITARYHLGTLGAEETLHYIAFRLRVAGGRKKVMFTRRAVRTVHKISQGTPRVINALCDRALLIGYTKETRTITPRIVKKAAEEIQGDHHIHVVRLKLGRLLPASALATSAATVLLLFLLATGPIPDMSQWVAAARSQVDQWLATRADISESSGNVAAPREVSDGEEQVAGRVPLATVFPDAPASEPPVEELPLLRGVVEAASRTEPAANVPTVTETVEAEEPESPVQTARRPEDPDASLKAADADPEPEPMPHQGVAELVRAWNLAQLEEPPEEVTVVSLDGFSRRAGLQLTELSSTIDQLLAINLPVLVRLREEPAGEAEAAAWFALMHAEDDTVRLVASDGTVEAVSKNIVRQRYTGEAYCLWDDPQHGAEPLRAMVENADVRQLQEDLTALGLFDGELNGRYDGQTIDAVTRIQRAMGLVTDGIVGPQTRMVLCSWLERYETPHLLARAFSDTAKDRVLASRGMVSARAGIGPDIEPVDSVPLPEFDPPREPAVSAREGGNSAVDEVAEQADRDDTEESVADSVSETAAPAADTVTVDDLGEPVYVPQLESSAFVPHVSTTPSFGPAAPIVPRSEGDVSSL